MVRGLMLALLALAAIAFSLTSEIALIGGTRGDLAATRAGVIAQSELRRARLQDARTELLSLAPSRPVGEIEADVAKLLADNPRAGDCHIMDGPVSRSVCPQIAALNGEIDRTQRRAELQTVIAKLTDAIPATVGAADPASSALSTYLAALGIPVPADVIARWLTLVPVLALELGAALPAVLMDAVAAGQRANPIEKTDSAGCPNSAAVDRSDRSGQRVAKPRQSYVDGQRRRRGPSKPAKDRRPRANASAQTRIMEALKKRGGRIEAGSVRKIAKLVRGRRSTVHAALGMLVAAGAVVKAGRALTLA